MSLQPRHKPDDIQRSQLDTLRLSLRLERVAHQSLGISTLSQRGDFDLDFYELHVSHIKDALYRAFEAGREFAIKQQAQ